MTIIFNRDDLAAMAGLRRSFDPGELFNPAKVFPKGTGCGELAEWRRKGVQWQELLSGRVNPARALNEHGTVGGDLWV